VPAVARLLAPLIAVLSQIGDDGAQLGV